MSGMCLIKCVRTSSLFLSILYMYTMTLYHFSPSNSSKITLSKFFSQIHVLYFLKNYNQLGTIIAARIWWILESFIKALESYHWTHPCKTMCIFTFLLSLQKHKNNIHNCTFIFSFYKLLAMILLFSPKYCFLLVIGLLDINTFACMYHGTFFFSLSTMEDNFVVYSSLC